MSTYISKLLEGFQAWVGGKVTFLLRRPARIQVSIRIRTTFLDPISDATPCHCPVQAVFLASTLPVEEGLVRGRFCLLGTIRPLLVLYRIVNFHNLPDT